MKKVFKSFTFWFFIISILIILVNLLGYDDKHILLIGLNPIFILTTYRDSFGNILWDNGPSFYIYILHFVTFIIYGRILDVIIYGVRYIVKSVKELNKKLDS